MKFIYSGKEYSVDLAKFARRKKGKASKLHQKTKEIVEKLFPMQVMIEEFPLPGVKPKLYIDIFLPSRKIAFECQGIQHIQYTPFFHKDKKAFIKAQANDNKKRDWCHQNDIILVEIFDSDDIEGKINESKHK